MTQISNATTETIVLGCFGYGTVAWYGRMGPGMASMPQKRDGMVLGCTGQPGYGMGLLVGIYSNPLSVCVCEVLK